ncbi:MAG: hypothetical protein HGA37_05830, partial [Lentimicrobium sp.]|nr:hypothetical protein [Lentimicrobium sp.]
MENNRETLVVLAEEIASVFVPLKDALAGPREFTAFMAELGWDILTLPAPVQNLGAAVQGIIDTLEAGDLDSASVPGLMAKITGLVSSIKDLGTNPAGWLPGTVDLNEFKNEFPAQLIQTLLVEYLEGNQAKVGRVLSAIGIIRVSFQAAQPAKKRIPYFKKEIALADLGNFFTDPTAVFTNAYQWGTPAFKADALWDNFFRLGSAFGFTVRQEAIHPAVKAALTNGAIDPSKIKPLQLKFILLEDNSSPLHFSTGVAVYLLPQTALKMPGIAFLPFASGGVA